MKGARLYIVFVSVVCCLFDSAAQTVEWSNQQKVKAKNYFSMVLGGNGSGIFVLRSKSSSFSRDVQIEKYKNNLSVEETKDFWQPPGSFIEKTFLNENGIKVFASQKANSKIELMHWQADNNLSTIPQTTLLLQVDQAIFKENNTFYIRQNTTSNKYAVAYITASTTQKNESVLNLAIFNEQLVFQFQKQFPINHASEDVFVTNIDIDNNDNVIVLMDFPNPKETGKRKRKRIHVAYVYFEDEKSLYEYPISKDSLWIDDIGFAINNINHTLHIAGFYKDEKQGNKPGSFSYAIDLELKQIKSELFELFSKEMVLKIAGVTAGSNDYAYDYYIRKIIPRSDGGCILVAEKYYETFQTYTYYVNGFPQTSSRTVYNYDEILLMSKNATGATQYQELIKKRQSSMNDEGYFSSFIFMNTNDKLVFIYNSDASAEGDVMITSFTPNGLIDTKILIKSLSFYVSLMPAEAKQINSKTLLAGTLKDRRFSLMRLTF